jgi:hypothetical protein
MSLDCCSVAYEVWPNQYFCQLCHRNLESSAHGGAPNLAGSLQLELMTTFSPAKLVSGCCTHGLVQRVVRGFIKIADNYQNYLFNVLSINFYFPTIETLYFFRENCKTPLAF